MKKTYRKPNITVHAMEMQSMLCAASETKGFDGTVKKPGEAWAPSRIEFSYDDEGEDDDESDRYLFGRLW